MYIGNDLQIAHPSYKIIDDISSGFNGSTTSFALQVSGSTPVPFPISTQQVMISVNGVVQEPDPTGSAGFKLLGSNIVFSSAPANGHAFFGVINAGADYVTAGSEFPDGSVTAPSFTFQDDQDTGWYRIGSGSVGYSANGVQILDFDGNGLNIPDDKKLIVGSGSDLKIFHDANHSYIQDSGTGNLNIDSSSVLIRNAGGTENIAKFIADGQVELYHDNAKKLETFASGITVLGSEGSAGQIQLFSDEGDDNADKWRLTKEAGNNSFRIQNYTSGSWETSILATGDAGVHLYYDDSTVCYTDTAALRFNDNKYLKLGSSQDLQIYHDGTNSYIKNTTNDLTIWDDSRIRFRTPSFMVNNEADNENLLVATENGSVDLYYDNVKKLETDGNGINVIDNDSTVEVSLTDSNGAAGHVYGNSSSGLIALLVGNGETSVAGYQNGATQLFHDNVKKFETTSTGVTVTGSVTDDKGNLRSIPLNSKNGAYTLIASDAGKAIDQQSGGWTVNNSVFSAGDAVTLINNSGSDQTITQGSGLTIYNTADATTGNRTLAGRGMATIIFLSASNCYISGAGLS